MLGDACEGSLLQLSQVGQTEDRQGYGARVVPGEPSQGQGPGRAVLGATQERQVWVSGSGKSVTGRCRGHLEARSGLTRLRQDPEWSRAGPCQAGPQQVPGLRGQGCASQIRKKG